MPLDLDLRALGYFERHEALPDFGDASENSAVRYRFIALRECLDHFRVLFLTFHLRPNHQKPQNHDGDQHDQKARHAGLLAGGNLSTEEGDLDFTELDGTALDLHPGPA